MLLDLFFSFLQIGLFGIGGGLVSVSLLMQQIVYQREWLSATAFNDLIAIAESTPGPLVVNSATFIGMQLGGLPGAVTATFASVLPGFMIALALAMLYQRYRSLSLIQGIMDGLRPVIVALIFVGGLKIGRSALFMDGIIAFQNIDPLSVALFAVCFYVIRKWKLSPVIVILSCGAIGCLLRMLPGLLI